MYLRYKPRGNVVHCCRAQNHQSLLNSAGNQPPRPQTCFPIYFSLLSGIITCTLQRMTRRTKGPFAIIRIKGTGLLNITVGPGSGYPGNTSLRVQRRGNGWQGRLKGDPWTAPPVYQCTAGTVWYWDMARPIPHWAALFAHDIVQLSGIIDSGDGEMFRLWLKMILFSLQSHNVHHTELAW